MSATRWANTLLSALAGGGVRRVVVSPGSRSTPLAHAAAITPGLRVYSIIDERSAGFFAIGQARVTGEPTLLIATSGSAAAHYLPAVMEAKHADLPLLILTADRPFELQNAGASQTTDQLHLYGRFVRRFFELGTPEEDEGALAGLAHLAARAVRVAMEERGPVHINARFRKPLEPSPPEHTTESAAVQPRAAAGRSLRVPSRGQVEALAERVLASERPLIVAGPASIQEAPEPAVVGALARRLGAPILAEATSQLRFADLGPGVIRADRFDLYLDLPGAFAAVAPDLVLELGRTPTSGSYARYLAGRSGLARVVVGPAPDADPMGHADFVFQTDLSPTLSMLVDAVGRGLGRSEWASRFSALEARAEGALQGFVAERSGLGELEVVRALFEVLPPDALLMLGNSLPLRHVDRWTTGAEARVSVLSQRGLSGIDGLISGAAGSAAASGRPLLLLVGDVSFLHDLGGLLAARLVNTPLVLLVIHNDGGRIFEELPIGRSPVAAPHLELWTTPHGVAFGGAAQSFGIPHIRACTVSELKAGLEQALVRSGPSIIEAVVPPGDAEATWRHVRERLEAGAVS